MSAPLPIMRSTFTYIYAFDTFHAPETGQRVECPVACVFVVQFFRSGSGLLIVSLWPRVACT